MFKKRSQVVAINGLPVRVLSSTFNTIVGSITIVLYTLLYAQVKLTKVKP